MSRYQVKKRVHHNCAVRARKPAMNVSVPGKKRVHHSWRRAGALPRSASPQQVYVFEDVTLDLGPPRHVHASFLQ